MLKVVALVLSSERPACFAVLGEGIALARASIDGLVLVGLLPLERLLVRVEIARREVRLNLHLRELVLLGVFKGTLLFFVRVAADVGLEVRLAFITPILFPVVLSFRVARY